MRYDQRPPRFYVRLGRVCAEMERHEGYTLVSRAAQVAATWRSYLGWLLARALDPRRRA